MSGGQAAAPRLAIAGLTKAFAGKPVLRGLDLEVGAGESVVVIGASGSGKSVTLKAVLGLLPSDGGRIALDGQDITHARGRRRDAARARIGMLFQGSALFDSLPVWRNVSFGLMQSGRVRDRGRARAIAVETLGRVGLAAAAADLFPAELSGGMQKRVALARAIAAEPDLLFFDEPTTGLDPIMANVINRLIVDAVRRLGASALTITHDMTSARMIADRVAMLHQGRIRWQGPVADLDRSGDAIVDQFIHGRTDPAAA